MKRNNIRILFLLVLITMLSFDAYTQEGERVKDFFSPYFIAGTPSVADQMAPQSAAINPASSALVQRITLDLNYSAIVGNEGNISGIEGHAVNIGNTLPTKMGVFSWSGHLLTSNFPSFYAPLSFTLSGAFSKDLYPDFLVGAGIKFAFSEEPGIAAAVDLGAIFLPGTIWILEDTAVGISLQDLGWIDIKDGYQDPYTLTAGIKGTILKNKNFTINVISDLGFPGFKSVLFSIGGNIKFRDFVSLNLGSRMDLNEIINGNAYGFIPSVGLNFTFQTSIDKKSNFLGLSEKGWNKSDINIQTVAAPLAPGVWTFGTGVNIPLGVIDKEAPEIELDLSGFEDQTMLPLSSGSQPVAWKKNSYNYTGKAIFKKRINRNVKFVDSTKNSSEKNIDIKKDENYPGHTILTYISPNNDGIKDDLKIPLKINESRYIKGYSLIVKNEKGEIVREIKNKEKRSENQGFKGFFDRLFSVKSGITVPEELRWDGFNNTGTVVSDGIYFFHIEAWDDNGNLNKTKEYAVVVDNTPPEITITPPSEDDKIFSPNNDGNKDTIVVNQEGSVEDEWIGTVYNAEGSPVKTFIWVNASPEKFVWDGKNDQNGMVSDGVYSYSVTATDRAGNSTKQGFDNIIKNTEQTPIALLIDKQFFSPNNDKIMDTLLFTPVVDVKTGIVKWKLIIFDSKDRERKVFEGTENIPDTILYDGRDNSGIILEEDNYYARLDMTYKNGNTPTAKSPDFSIDITPPAATVRTNTAVFSPNGDGEKDIIKLFQESSLEKVWTASIKSVTGKIVYNYQWVGTADPEVDWNGIGEEGRLSTDGVYTYQLSAVDRAGNLGESNIVSFRLDTEKTAVILTTEYSEFSPNRDGVKDNIKIIPEVTVKDGISEYTLSILNSDARIVKTYKEKKKLPDFFKWDGNDNHGNRVPDGIYSARLILIYEKGDKPVAVSRNFEVDTVFPEISAEAEFLLFSPDGDGKKDNIIIKQVSDSKELWRGEIIDSQDNAIKTVFWKNGVTNFSWNGTDTAGNRVKDGIYSYIISATDSAGNHTQKEIKGIRVDTTITKVFVTASSAYLSPTGNGRYEDITFRTIVTKKEGIDSWSLKLIRENGTVEKEFSGTNRIPEKVIWDGSNEKGTFSEGVYTAFFKVIYKKGNEPEAHTPKFTLDITPPSAYINLSPLPFSPDNDGVNDDLDIALQVKDQSGVKKWKLDIFDPENRLFISYSGKGVPAEKIIWNGTSSTGELVYAAMDYPVILYVEDILGNITIVKKKIPVDVLVVKEGDHLKIKIANIIFKKNSAQLVDDNPETARTNEFVLNRISEILKKYKSYQIVIEGHAVVTRWNDPEAAKIEEENELKPLSKKRAQTVLDDLVKRGISASRMEAVGAGGQNPLVPNSDLENRWKNRRVEFILRKK